MKLFIFRFIGWINYQFKAVGAHGLHSPFLFSFYNNVIKSKIKNGKGSAFRKEVLRSSSVIRFNEFKTGIEKQLKVSDLARSSGISDQFGNFLVKLTNWLKASTIIETGTSLGISSVYLASSNASHIVTVEGSETLAQTANTNLKARGINKVIIKTGSVNDLLAKCLDDEKPELVFLDADHQGSELIKQVNTVLKSPSVSCLVIHDIYWSRDMLTAWNTIRNYSTVSLSVDIFEAGIMFPKLEMEKQHFFIRF